MRSDWPEMLLLDVWVVKDRAGDWSALSTDFDLVAKGATREAALADLDEIVHDYVKDAVGEGLSYGQALRPVPLRDRARLHMLGVASRLRRRRRAREGSLVVRPDLRAC